jgi:fumarylacetoacetase
MTHPALDATHDPALTSWVDSANAADSDFPIQNLPLGRFSRAGSGQAPRAGVAIGDQVLDLALAAAVPGWAAGLGAARADALAALAAGDVNRFLALGPAVRGALRQALSAALATGSPHQAALAPCLLPQAEAVMALPCAIGDYTDFYTGIHHATAVGRLFRPDQPLMPNYKWVPIGYHGRSSSIVVSGTPVRRPLGQTAPAADGDGRPGFGPCQRLDHELELGLVVGSANPLGQPLTMKQAEAALAGVVLLNDWSARDLQAWEYQPLGPFLAKNFASSVSPWLVTMEALAPFRRPFVREPGEPAPLPHLDSAANREAGAIDITLEVWLHTAQAQAAGQAPVRLSQGRWPEAAYWTAAQLVAHHTSNGCNLQPGDLLGTGTLSGPLPGQAGSLLELTQGGKQPITLPDGTQRRFLQDGDTLVLRGFAQAPGARRIGLGECRGTVLAGPAVA